MTDRSTPTDLADALRPDAGPDAGPAATRGAPP